MSRANRSKAKRSREKIRTLVPTRVDDRGRHEQRSMRLNDAFDNFRRELNGRQIHGLQCLIDASQEKSGC
jgi:hypothetical protein